MVFVAGKNFPASKDGMKKAMGVMIQQDKSRSTKTDKKMKMAKKAYPQNTKHPSGWPC